MLSVVSETTNALVDACCTITPGHCQTCLGHQIRPLLKRSISAYCQAADMVRVSGACKASFDVPCQEQGGTGKLRRQVIDHLRKSVVVPAQLQEAARSSHNSSTHLQIWPTWILSNLSAVDRSSRCNQGRCQGLLCSALLLGRRAFSLACRLISCPCQPTMSRRTLRFWCCALPQRPPGSRLTSSSSGRSDWTA